ncbi:16S rRNA (guanine(966)-N(2))-methyltransferase RsmD [Pelagibacterales bacterium SAG-MED20]|nr:16S rRNA (guanine(966)-N(2))-methyltransferase RsmD [Pelagibacterales bacterium SAG-MED20]
MRIISGNSKGKKILEPTDLNTRPLKDLTKESIFNIIMHSNKFSVKIENSRVLDLFSGVGSFGLECLSRGSSFITFIENYKEVLPILKKNISNMDFQDITSIIEENVFNLRFQILKKKSFDIIFMDPPYKENNLFSLVKCIIESEILTKDGIIVIHRHKKKKDKFPKKFNILEEKKYGISKIIFGNFF